MLDLAMGAALGTISVFALCAARYLWIAGSVRRLDLPDPAIHPPRIRWWRFREVRDTVRAMLATTPPPPYTSIPDEADNAV